MSGHSRSEDEVVRAQVRDTLDAHAPAVERQNRVVAVLIIG